MNEEKTNQKCGQLEELPITDIIPSGDNPRIINEKDSAFVELADSIRAQGVIVPVHVRIHPEQKKRFELLAGERRLRAS
ncbi:MAG: ParB N-terminal domain-containing protein, partial [Phycisphaerae bacterium]|nr:ParB N-terminal domain-containing protein [Phycisphaerae bacterium]NIS22534.1 ParB N-terminal domain-containing protein [candidate division KSB1 bacterium]NIP55106.1 ParB N-terminal domain-containing protein [Phycisphaerae bacterium]NIS49728.1 ParB N-terminal domain-containing protein [Phycisphaerae bacterium]NIU28761.1 ParB N-terminal domain-containing protein [candidate division KSB1 bacterium]